MKDGFSFDGDTNTIEIRQSGKKVSFRIEGDDAFIKSEEIIQFVKHCMESSKIAAVRHFIDQLQGSIKN